MAFDVSDSLKHVVVILRGTFDEVEAEGVAAALRAMDLNRPLTLDFREVDLFSDYAVVRLVNELARSLKARPALIGLYEHHYRLLRYVGLAEVLSAPSWEHDDGPSGFITLEASAP